LAEVKKDISMMRGIIPSLHTPFNEKNEIDIAIKIIEKVCSQIK